MGGMLSGVRRKPIPRRFHVLFFDTLVLHVYTCYILPTTTRSPRLAPEQMCQINYDQMIQIQ